MSDKPKVVKPDYEKYNVTLSGDNKRRIEELEREIKELRCLIMTLLAQPRESVERTVIEDNTFTGPYWSVIPPPRQYTVTKTTTSIPDPRTIHCCKGINEEPK